VTWRSTLTHYLILGKVILSTYICQVRRVGLCGAFPPRLLMYYFMTYRDHFIYINTHLFERSTLLLTLGCLLIYRQFTRLRLVFASHFFVLFLIDSFVDLMLHIFRMPYLRTLSVYCSFLISASM
jgi:hypothetical protein